MYRLVLQFPPKAVGSTWCYGRNAKVLLENKQVEDKPDTLSGSVRHSNFPSGKIFLWRKTTPFSPARAHSRPPRTSCLPQCPSNPLSLASFLPTSRSNGGSSCAVTPKRPECSAALPIRFLLLCSHTLHSMSTNPCTSTSFPCNRSVEGPRWTSMPSTSVMSLADARFTSSLSLPAGCHMTASFWMVLPEGWRTRMATFAVRSCPFWRGACCAVAVFSVSRFSIPFLPFDTHVRSSRGGASFRSTSLSFSRTGPSKNRQSMGAMPTLHFKSRGG